MLWVSLGAAPLAAQADEPAEASTAGVPLLIPTESGVEEHVHDGFFARLSVGAGGIRIGTTDATAIGFELSGFGTVSSIAVGFAPSEDVILAIDLMLGSVVDPQLTVEGSPTGEASASTAAIGANVTYYINPVNVYLSGTIGVGMTVVETGLDTEPEPSDVGLALGVMLGKEWWLGSEWGVGGALQLTFMHLPSGPTPIDTGSVGLLFSATYN